MRKDTSDYVKACKTYDTKKDDRYKEYGTTVRVPVAELPWQEIQLECITDLPVKCRIIMEEGYAWETRRVGSILVCSGKLTKMIHLIGFKPLLNANETDDAFLEEIYSLNVFSKEVTTDRGTQFISHVLKKLLEFFESMLRTIIFSSSVLLNLLNSERYS